MDCRCLLRNSTVRRRTRLAKGVSCRERSTVWAAGRERQRTGCQASLASVRIEEAAVSLVPSGPAMALAAAPARRV